MVKITIRRDERAQHIFVEANGHAGGAPAGQNLICAAVSALLYGFALEVASIPPHRFVAGGRVDFGTLSGHCLMDLTCRDRRTYRRLSAALSPVERTLIKFSEEWPQDVTVSRF